MNKVKGNVYLRSEFELNCSADTVFRITANHARTFTSGFVTEISEEKTSVNALRATWTVNGVQTEELGAEKTLLLEEQLTFQLLNSLTNLPWRSASVTGNREASYLTVLLLFIVCV